MLNTLETQVIDQLLQHKHQVIDMLQDAIPVGCRNAVYSLINKSIIQADSVGITKDAITYYSLTEPFLNSFHELLMKLDDPDFVISKKYVNHDFNFLIILRYSDNTYHLTGYSTKLVVPPQFVTLIQLNTIYPLSCFETWVMTANQVT